jgi:hypothetical protein
MQHQFISYVNTSYMQWNLYPALPNVLQVLFIFLGNKSCSPQLWIVFITEHTGVNAEADMDDTREADDAFHEDCIRLGAKNNINLSSWASVDSELPTCGVPSIYGMGIDREGGPEHQKARGRRMWTRNTAKFYQSTYVSLQTVQ